MHCFKFRSLVESLRSVQTRTLLVLTLVLCLSLAACFGGDEETPTPLPAATATVEASVEATVAPTAEPTAATESAPEATSAASEAAPAEGASGKLQRFQIDPAQSEARFIVDEVLFGNPNTVTGRTTEVSGQLEINPSDPAQTNVGEIQINARSLATDNRFRNRSINRLILESNKDEYQFITFTPTAIDGLPATASAGDSFDFQMTGDLKIRDVVKPVTFDVSVTADSATQVSGLAQAVIQRADFDLTIPNVEGVADVTEDVHLELQFVATASE